jgi:hypothetical protein
MGFFDKLTNVFNNIGSKISGSANFIAHKLPIVKNVIDVGRGVLNTASNFAQSDTGKLLGSVIPYGEAIRQGVIKTSDIVNRGSNLFNKVNDAVQNVNSQINKNSNPGDNPATNPKDVVESIVQSNPTINPRAGKSIVEDNEGGRLGKGSLER